MIGRQDAGSAFWSSRLCRLRRKARGVPGSRQPAACRRLGARHAAHLARACRRIRRRHRLRSAGRVCCRSRGEARHATPEDRGIAAGLHWHGPRRRDAGPDLGQPAAPRPVRRASLSRRAALQLALPFRGQGLPRPWRRAVRGLPGARRGLSRAASGRRHLHHGMHRLGRGIHPQLPALQRPLDAVGGQPAGARPAGQGRLQHRHRCRRRAAAAFRSSVRQADRNRRRRIHDRSRQPDRDPAPRPSGQEFLRALRHARSLLDLLRRGRGLASVHDPGGLRRGERHARQHGELPAPGLRVLRRRQPGGRDRDLPAGDRRALRLGRTDPHLDLRARVAGLPACPPLFPVAR